jgi:hypothetical protein
MCQKCWICVHYASVADIRITLLWDLTPCNLLDALHKTAVFVVITEGISHVTFLCSQQNMQYSVN